MSPVFGFTHYARVTRRVTVGQDGAITVVDNPETWFESMLVRTGQPWAGTDSGSPRRARPDRLRYLASALGPAGASLRAGNRLELASTTYEILEDPREVKLGARLAGYEIPALALTRLYPYLGTVEELGGADVRANVRFSVFTASEEHRETGMYEDYNAETDLSNRDIMRVNRQVSSGSNIYKITSAEVDLAGAYVRMTVRKAGRG